MISKQRTETYYLHFYQVQNMMTQNTLEADKALMTFSIAALAALAAMNSQLFAHYGKLSFLAIFCFTAVIAGVVVGYLVSSALLKDAQDKLTSNYLDGKKPLYQDTKKLRFGTLSYILNWVNFALFIIGIIFFLVLLMEYIKGLPNA